MLVEPLSATRAFPHGSFARPSKAPSIVTGFVTPRISRLPETASPSPLCAMCVLLNVIFGYSLAWKKSSDLRCPSRWASRVSIVATSISAVIAEGMELPAGISIVPETPLKRPRTLEIARWRTENSTPEWAGSIAKVSVVRVDMDCSSSGKMKKASPS